MVSDFRVLETEGEAVDLDFLAVDPEMRRFSLLVPFSLLLLLPPQLLVFRLPQQFNLQLPRAQLHPLDLRRRRGSWYCMSSGSPGSVVFGRSREQITENLSCDVRSYTTTQEHIARYLQGLNVVIMVTYIASSVVFVYLYFVPSGPVNSSRNGEMFLSSFCSILFYHAYRLREIL
ncbi:hypothetical protein VTO42DRAFT_3104 [Malbranchea cinnamomea]